MVKIAISLRHYYSKHLWLRKSEVSESDFSSYLVSPPQI